jgi:hypothetical protein
MIGLDDLAKLDGLDTIIIEASATDASQQRRVFALLGEGINPVTLFCSRLGSC